MDRKKKLRVQKGDQLSERMSHSKQGTAQLHSCHIRHLPWHCKSTPKTPQAVKRRRLKKTNAVERPFYERDSCDEKKIDKLQKNKNSQATLLGLMRRQHSKLPPAGIVATFVPRRTPPDGARRHRLVCPGTGQAQRAEILPLRNASGRILSQRGCAVQHYQLRPNC